MFSFAKKLVDRLEGHSPNPADEAYFKGITRINNNGFGLRVLHVQSHSAAQLAGFEAWFDYIVRINHHELPMKHQSASRAVYGINDDGSISYGSRSADSKAGEFDIDAISQELVAAAASGNKSVTFDVWNAKGGILRQILVLLDPYTYTPQKLPDSVQEIFHDKFKQIGITVQSSHVDSATFVWRILNTHPNSPAFQAQLIPFSDYVVGCDSAFPTDDNGKGLLTKGGESLLSKTILSYYNHHFATLGEDNIPITLYVYNHDYDIVRPVTVHLSKSWAVGGNRGILGCDVGYGLLHRIPEVIGKFDLSIEKIDDVIFENKSDYSYKLEKTPVPAFQEPREQSTKPASPVLTSSLMGMTAFIPEEFVPQQPTPQVSQAPPVAPAPQTIPVRNSLVLAPVSQGPTPLAPFSQIAPSQNAVANTPPIPTIGSNPPPVAPGTGVPPTIAPAKTHRKKKQHASNGIGSLTDFMNEELTKSKKSDVKYPNGDEGSTPPPPPPPRSAR